MRKTIFNQLTKKAQFWEEQPSETKLLLLELQSTLGCPKIKYCKTMIAKQIKEKISRELLPIKRKKGSSRELGVYSTPTFSYGKTDDMTRISYSLGQLDQDWERRISCVV